MSGWRACDQRCEPPQVLSDSGKNKFILRAAGLRVRLWQILLQKSFCGMGLKFSEARARRLNNDVGDHVATRQTHRRFWQRVCGSIERRLSLVSFFGENLAAVAFGTFSTVSART